ncbi:DNA helicase UvrD [Rhodobacterales bacterium 56_14_T64]|nr:DNA helicase UvrD [Rhodobacterales bacterium 56_14_T64]
MKHLGRVVPSPEQLAIMSTNRLGTELIRGSAGSGKTTTALLRLKSLTNFMKARKGREGNEDPVRVLLLTFNRTLAGYVRALAEEQMLDPTHELEIATFAKWARDNLGEPNIDDSAARTYLRSLSEKFDTLETDYLIQEVEYLLGRFEPDKLENYIGTERTGRGTLPRVGPALRRRILDEVVYPYVHHLNSEGLLDWNGLALDVRQKLSSLDYDIVVVDESQDFSANQLRAIRHHLAENHAIIFVIDTAQRIYARGFTWIEAGYEIAGNRSHRLGENHRNTRQIASFAAGLLDGMLVDVDGVLPDLNAAKTDGPLPQVLSGRYPLQLDWAINYIRQHVDLENETVAFLKPKAGKWFDFVRTRLKNEDIGFVDMTRRSEWPDGHENVAISTFHSAKGLEYDHVIILGFNQETTEFGEEEVSDQVRVLRSLLAVAVARARKQVIVGYKPGEESRLTQFFSDHTYEEISL